MYISGSCSRNDIRCGGSDGDACYTGFSEQDEAANMTITRTACLPDRQAKKYRITIQNRVSYGLSCSPIDVEDFQEFKDYLGEKGIFQVSLGYFDMIDDYPQIHEAGIKVDDITMKHFEWLVTKSFGRSRHMEVVLNKH